jgi:hypothetical protein
MANAVLTKTDAAATFTLSLASLANGSARQSDVIANSNNRPAAIVYLKIKSGAVAPSAGGTYTVHLIRSNKSSSPDYRSDGAGASDAAITMENARFLGAIVVTATADKVFYGEFDTSPWGPLGPEWGIIVRNGSGQAVSATEADHFKGYVYYYPELQ